VRIRADRRCGVASSTPASRRRISTQINSARAANDTYSLFERQYRVAHSRCLSLSSHRVPDLHASRIRDGPGTRFPKPGSRMASVRCHVSSPNLSCDVQMERRRIYRNVVYNPVLFSSCFSCGHIAAFNRSPCSFGDRSPDLRIRQIRQPQRTSAVNRYHFRVTRGLHALAW
jgi:hypothetical protein